MALPVGVVLVAGVALPVGVVLVAGLLEAVLHLFLVILAVVSS